MRTSSYTWLLVISVALATGILSYFIWGNSDPALAQEEQVEEEWTEAVSDLPSTQRISNQNVKALRLPDSLFFAGEPVPLNDPDVVERLDREMHVNTFFHSNTIFLIKRARRWFPQIEPILKEHGLPDDFKYLAVIESDLQNKVSPARAVGFWQLVKGTARERGLVVTRDVDERYHPLKSTVAACDYLLQAKERFGTWTNAAASYNIGQYGLDKRLKEQQVDSYYDLLLNEETARYMLRLLAIKLVLENPEEFGFYIEEDQLYHPEPLKTVTISEKIDDLVSWAQARGVTYKTLKRHNPWMRRPQIGAPPRGKTWQVSLPTYAHEPLAPADSLSSD